MKNLDQLDKELPVYNETNSIFNVDAIDLIYRKMKKKINKLKAKVEANKVSPHEVRCFFDNKPEYSEVFPETFEALYRTIPAKSWEEHFKNVSFETIKKYGDKRRTTGERV